MTAVSEINVTPLIDLAFSLLIIFMITTPLLEQTIPLELPVESQRPQVSREDVQFQVISIDGAGQVFWGQDPVSMPKLNDLLASLAAEPNPPVISLRADRTIRYQKVIDVVNLIKEHKLSRLNLDTQVK
ncbi:biopolymer transporter ExbD [Ruficoccus amylovorans]|uniref:Biopolymer transporter ExbD n=1 Tax=Ruficoccus amylovorans TaxID=1804625 RepID=A0A842HDA7_9BACT|nr:biopolymer transporter ExbD [Ruficoccus amylovorans]MBC2594210.1 biopolymer transporter ExbD [Ruficoccus amylovorans]